jgi:dihydroxyacetone kinase phosphoprotein-dependent L subunit
MTAGALMTDLSRAVLTEIERRQGEFDGLDQIAGDGDHGATMVLGARAVVLAMENAPPELSYGGLLKHAAAAFASVGGSIGPLWGSALLRAGQTLGDERDPPIARFAEAAAAACDAVRHRGRVEEGDKTLLDVLAPAARALSGASAGHASREETLAAVTEAARGGLARSSELIPRRGRARRFGDRSVGHADPGAASACCVIEVVCDALEHRADE